MLISMVVRDVTWLKFLWLELDNAGAWGVVAGPTNLIPYVGAVLVGFGQLWGPVGLILGVPLVLVVDAVYECVEQPKPVGLFLGP